MSPSRSRLPRVLPAAAIACVLSSPSLGHADPPTTTTIDVGQHFQINPVADGVITATGLGFAGLLGLVLQTGEIRPVGPIADSSVLLPIDRIAVTQTIDRNASTYSDIGLWSAIGFTGLDAILSATRDGWDAGLVDAVMYAESLSLTLTLTDITKIAVRRPRPLDYKYPDLSNTDMELSFFSGHASALGAITGTATYLAFVRSPHTARPWITLAVGTLLTTFVDYERIRAGAHFPTDVVAGSMAGAAVGVLVPHLHRRQEESVPMWIGAAPASQGSGGTLSLQGLF